jgi:hypothetical protein
MPLRNLEARATNEVECFQIARDRMVSSRIERFRRKLYWLPYRNDRADREETTTLFLRRLRAHRVLGI